MLYCEMDSNNLSCSDSDVTSKVYYNILILIMLNEYIVAKGYIMHMQILYLFNTVDELYLADSLKTRLTYIYIYILIYYVIGVKSICHLL